MIDFLDAKRVAGMLSAVGEPTRMMILYRLALGPHHVGQLAEMLKVPMVNMSHHLGVMRQAGLLEDEKDGRRVVYRFRPEIFTPPSGSDPDVLATLTLGVYRLVLRKGGNGAGIRARSKRKPARKPAPKPAVPAGD
ncbi:MAG TPA: metalloregulator ArsR/SmtB family transcription factor [Gemmataceae bacterium]|nr:metalloregulator ArsR/SmtB family transcription factor [Gemmataceae bacterium]